MSKIKKYDMGKGDFLFLGPVGPTIRTYLAVVISMGMKDKVILIDKEPVDLKKLFDDDRLIQIPNTLRKEVEPKEIEIISNFNEIFPKDFVKVDPLVGEKPWYMRFDKQKKDQYKSFKPQTKKKGTRKKWIPSFFIMKLNYLFST